MIQKLDTSTITSEVYPLVPTQLDDIAINFSDAVARAMNMHALAPRMREIAIREIRNAIMSVRKK